MKNDTKTSLCYSPFKQLWALARPAYAERFFLFKIDILVIILFAGATYCSYGFQTLC